MTLYTLVRFNLNRTVTLNLELGHKMFFFLFSIIFCAIWSENVSTCHNNLSMCLINLDICRCFKTGHESTAHLGLETFQVVQVRFSQKGSESLPKLTSEKDF